MEGLFVNLFILGNGFDLGHDIPTRYGDFRNYLRIEEPCFLDNFERAYYIGIPELWANLEGELANIQDDVLFESMFQETDLGLESGNTGIVDTLTYYFESQFNYIEELTEHLKSWIEGINSNIEDYNVKTSSISPSNNDLFINFNYTKTLEDLYGIAEEQIIHIHGCANLYEDLVLGHSNIDRVNHFINLRNEMENKFDEQSSPIYDALANYCDKTFKDVSLYIDDLYKFDYSSVKRINVIGHSLGDVDMPYFSRINELTTVDTEWYIYYFNPDDIPAMTRQLNVIGINSARINFVDVNTFYDL